MLYKVPNRCYTIAITKKGTAKGSKVKYGGSKGNY
nr:MAG TPA: hypothetical protein [Caudoviricetes sp.]